MSSFQDILKLCQEDGGRVFILDQKGEVRLVILAADEYKRIKSGKSNTAKAIVDVEAVNREITKAQMEDRVVTGRSLTAVDHPVDQDGVASIKSVLQNWHLNRAGTSVPKSQNMVEEVIDPSWNEDNVSLG